MNGHNFEPLTQYAVGILTTMARLKCFGIGNPICFRNQITPRNDARTGWLSYP